VSATAPSAGPLPFLASDNRGMPKTCSRCGLEKPLRDFYRQAGLEFTCKDYPKSDSGRRTIGLPRSVVDLLTEHLSKAAKASTSSRPVWSPASSVEFPPPALESCGQSRHPGATGLAPLAPHSRRATDPLRMAGIQHVRRLGWKDGTMLYRVYGHLFPNHDDDLVIDLERRLQDAREIGGTVVAMTRGG
jgi:hypothetical protein